jgi:hypothetical protein
MSHGVFLVSATNLDGTGGNNGSDSGEEIDSFQVVKCSVGVENTQDSSIIIWLHSRRESLYLLAEQQGRYLSSHDVASLLRKRERKQEKVRLQIDLNQSHRKQTRLDSTRQRHRLLHLPSS